MIDCEAMKIRVQASVTAAKAKGCDHTIFKTTWKRGASGLNMDRNVCRCGAHRVGFQLFLGTAPWYMPTPKVLLS